MNQKIPENKKNVSLIARCSKKDKDMIARNARRSGKKESVYIRDCCLAPAERKTDKLKRVLIMKIRVIEEMNKLAYIMEDKGDRIPEDIKQEIKDQMKRIGGIMNA